MLKTEYPAFCFSVNYTVPYTMFVHKIIFFNILLPSTYLCTVYLCMLTNACACIFYFRIGHDNFELVNHDIVNPLMIEGK